METQVRASQTPCHPRPKVPRPQYLGAVHLTVSDGGPRAPTISVAIAVGPVVTGGAAGASWKCRGRREEALCEERWWLGFRVAESGLWGRPGFGLVFCVHLKSQAQF